ncbi:flavocytochrome c [Turicimonas muris]|uniref:Urocanate reductase n=1 Tax=Turicimonas muris TaxID=1796652 RepID=A0A227KI91_9BURK|nr:flavocytochrome c [Turicimonas muris]ANU66957.1 flavocytochrome c [Burkholderiales bacterium YL45]MBS4767868.1 flavocytochrome c [Burkholderiales bacterium]OXE47585.1 flavocytochrome c [Turicimonas muris]QQQ95819.1 flavocytochrome c [Turicimonas muris]
MKFTFSVLAALVAAAFCAQEASMAKDGTYTATTLGRNGDVTVQVKIANNKIEDVKVLSWSETHPVADLPKAKVPADIVKNQSTNVNNVSGATLTTFAIKAAVQDCLKQAGLNPKDFSKMVPQPQKVTDNIEEKTDVIVVGAGGAGLSAAVAAAQRGLNVIVLEKAHFAGGNTSVSGGCFNAADPEGQKPINMTDGQRESIEKLLAEKPQNKLQEDLITQVKQQWADYKKSGSKSLFDTPELHALQSWKAGDYKANLELVYRLTKEAPEIQETLAKMGIIWQKKPTQFVGALWPRSHRASNYKSGVGYIDTYLDLIKAENLPVAFMMSTPAESLITKDDKVIGVKAKGPDGKTYTILASKGVILASGGFGANVKMRNEYDELWDKKLDEKVKTTNMPAITGDGINMALKVGAGVKDMGYIQLLPTTDPATGSTNHKIVESTNIYVNKLGNRFVNEQGRRDVLAKAALAQPDHIFYIIGTEQTLLKDKEGRGPYGILISDLLKQKKAFKADTLEELAKKVGMDPANLKRTVEKWNEFCKTQKGDEFGRMSCEDGNKLPGGPYYASLMTPSVHHTMGGLTIDKDTRVLNKAGKPIPGLFAAGEITGGIHGTNRVGCNAVPDALIYGTIAGREVGK